VGSAHDRDVVYTYRYLRGAMIALLLLLLLSVGYQWWWETDHSCWLGSISAYYYTPARTIFVGSLCALGAALIAYKGHSPEEDVLLNFSGLMAFVVAMVPTVPDNLCGPNAFTQTQAEIAMAVRNNIWSLIVITVISSLTAALLKRRAVAANSDAIPGARAIVVSVVCAGIVLAELTLFLVLPDRFIALSHGIAASTMVAGVIAVMVFSALRVADRHDGASAAGYQRTYIGLAVVLGILLGLTVLVGLTVPDFDHVILVAEVIIIVLFGAYWVVQTKELWNLQVPGPTEARSLQDVAQ
jgi:hypothetical protein